MEHPYFSDDNEKRISWIIQNNGAGSEQTREHAKIYCLVNNMPISIRFV